MKANEFLAHIQAFRVFNESKGLSPITISNYGKVLRIFARWFIAEHGKEAEITGRSIRAYLAHKRNEGKSPRTVQTYWGTIHAFFSFAVLDEIVPESLNPMRLVKPPRCRAPEIHPLTTAQVHALLGSFNKSYPCDHRDYVMVALMLDSGLRVGEVIPLTLADIDLEQGRVRVVGKGGKPRTVHIGQAMRQALKSYLRHGRPGLRRDKCQSLDTLFPPTRSSRKTINREYVSTIVKKRMDEVGIPRNNSSSHRLRHTFAATYLRNGGDVFTLQKLLGHSSLDMTRRYVLLNQEDLARAHQKASPLDNMEL